MVTSSSLKSITDFNRINETRGNHTVEAGDSSVSERNIEWQTCTHYKYGNLEIEELQLKLSLNVICYIPFSAGTIQLKIVLNILLKKNVDWPLFAFPLTIVFSNFHCYFLYIIPYFWPLFPTSYQKCENIFGNLAIIPLKCNSNRNSAKGLSVCVCVFVRGG